MKNSLWKSLGTQHTVVENTQKESPEEGLSPSEKSSTKNTWAARLSAIHLWISIQPSKRKRNRLKRAAQLLESLLVDEVSGGKSITESADFGAVVRRARQSKSIGFFQARSVKKLVHQYKAYGRPIASLLAAVQDNPEKPLKNKSTQKRQEAAVTEPIGNAQNPQTIWNSTKKLSGKDLDAGATNPKELTERSIAELLSRSDEATRWEEIASVQEMLQKETDEWEEFTSVQKMIQGEIDEWKNVSASAPVENIDKQEETSHEDIRATNYFEETSIASEEAFHVEEAKKSLLSLEVDKTDSSTHTQTATESHSQKEVSKEASADETFELNIAEDIAAWPRDDKVWTLGEWALLLDWHLKYANLTASQQRDQIRVFSHLLRTAAKEAGFPVNEQYRNEAGISSQHSYLTSYIAGSKGTYKYAAGMEQVVKLFRHRKSEFDLLLAAFQERLGVAEKLQDERDEEDESVESFTDADDLKIGRASCRERV